MKLLAICTFIICGFISSCTISTAAWGSEEEKKDSISPRTRAFLITFFGSASLVLPIVIAMPRRIDSKPTGESVPPSADNK
jgi:hypothetical protein